MNSSLAAPDGLVETERDNVDDYSNVFYVRHASMAASNEFVERIANDGKVVVHHDDIASTDREDYEDAGSRYAKNDIRDLKHATEKGALVGVTYSAIGRKHTRVGVIEPGTDVEFVRRQYDGSERIYKVAEISDYVDVEFTECPVIFVARSQQGPTISNYPKASRRAIKSIIGGKDVPRDVWSLSSGQFELLARRDMESRHDGLELRLPSGRTLKDVDVLGVDAKGDDIIAQVSFTNEPKTARNKRDDLLQYDADKRYLYVRERFAEICDGYDVTPRPAKTVFNELNQDERATSHISKMLDLSRVGSRHSG
jgi:hypothetical protein